MTVANVLPQWWEQFTTWLFVRRATRALASPIPPLDLSEPESVTLDALVDSLEATGKAALGAAIAVTDGDDSRWIFARSEDSLLALRAAVWKGYRPSAFLVAYPDPDNQAQVRLYLLTDLRTFKNFVAALRTA